MPTKDIQDAAFAIRDKWEEIKLEFIKRNPNKYLVITCVHRTPKEQLALFKKGRKLVSEGKWVIVNKSEVVTNVDGTKVLGSHNYYPARAIDVAVVDNKTGKYLWEESHYHSLLEIVEGVGLESGGRWKSLKDWPHIQIPNYRNV